MDRIFHKDERIDYLIVSYLDHHLTKDEEEELHSWLSLSEENRHYFVEMQDFYKTAGLKHEYIPDCETAYQRFQTHVSSKQKIKKSKKQVGFVYLFRRIAAVALIFLLCGLGYYYVNYRFPQGDKQYTIYAPYGSKTRIELPDKSVVWLNAGSTLTYAQNFGQKGRQVTLQGEGYFEITRNPAMPFTVRTKEVSVKVLGTKFDVKAYPDDRQLDVTLLHGSVQLTTIYQPENRLILKPNQLAVVDKVHKAVSVEQVNAKDAASWTEGKLVFKNESLERIARRLERDYNVTIDVKDNCLDSLRFYGDFCKTQSIQEIFDIMTSGNEFHYSMNKHQITIYK